MLAEAIEDGIIGSNPAARAGRSKALRLAATAGEREEHIKAFEREQLARLLVAVRERERRHFPMFFTMARTGLRLGEAFGLQWDDVDLAPGNVARLRPGPARAQLDPPHGRRVRPMAPEEGTGRRRPLRRRRSGREW